MSYEEQIAKLSERITVLEQQNKIMQKYIDRIVAVSDNKLSKLAARNARFFQTGSNNETISYQP